MNGSDIISKYFSLSESQRSQFEALGELYPEWNARINVISRKDIDNLYVNHVLHSLAIAKFIRPVAESAILDIGTGGGFPGIPLAIMWPDCHFHLIDRIGKKIRVAEDVARSIGLENVTLQHGDIGECRQTFDFVVSRAVMRLDALLPLVKKNIARAMRNAMPNGVIVLKGGDLADETKQVGYPVVEEDISLWFDEPFFATKKLVYVEM